MGSVYGGSRNVMRYGCPETRSFTGGNTAYSLEWRWRFLPKINNYAHNRNIFPRMTELCWRCYWNNGSYNPSTPCNVGYRSPHLPFIDALNCFLKSCNNSIRLFFPSFLGETHVIGATTVWQPIFPRHHCDPYSSLGATLVPNRHSTFQLAPPNISRNSNNSMRQHLMIQY